MKKLLKYDLQSVFRMWWVAFAVISILFVLGCLGAFNLRQEYDHSVAFDQITESFLSPVFSALASGSLLLFMSAAGIWVFGFVGLFAPLVCYYRSLFTDQAYLTFTLPVKNQTIYHSKLLTALIFLALTTLVQIVYGGILLLILLWGEPLDLIADVLSDPDLPILLFSALSFLVDSVVGVFSWYFAFNLGGFLFANKTKAVVGACFATTIGRSLLRSVLTPSFGFISYLNAFSNSEVAHLLSMATVLFFDLLVGWIFYMASRYLFEKKVNLV